MSGGEKGVDVEILALRNQLLVRQRQVGKPTFTDTGRAALSGVCPHHLPMRLCGLTWGGRGAGVSGRPGRPGSVGRGWIQPLPSGRSVFLDNGNHSPEKEAQA
jgi:hypothetical protein